MPHRKRMNPVFAGLAFVVAAMAPAAFSAPRLPAWVEQAKAAEFGDLPAKASAVVLRDEKIVEVRPDGKVVSTTLFAVRILTRDGRDMANARVPYLAKSERIESAGAWLIRPSGQVRAYVRKEFTDFAEFDNALYSESRNIGLSAAAEAEPGSVFAWEVRKTVQSVESQDIWAFQGAHPVVQSRYVVRLPAGWRVDGRVFNHAGVAPQVSGSETVWQLGQLPGLVAEPLAPSPATRAALLAVTLFPPDDASRRVLVRGFSSWADVSSFVAGLIEPTVTVDASIAAKAEELTRGIDDEWGRIRAIGQFAQRVSYVSIQTRLGLGGGLTPHPASQVLACNYGDCKDKATLMRALLRAVGIESHMVAVSSEDSPVVWEDWPSPSQFNHAIVAVRVSAAVDVPAMITDATLGRLVFFDPTDSLTIPGDLPGHYQGSPVLVVAGEQGALVRLPLLAPETSRLERKVTATLAPGGGIEARVHERSIGQAAKTERALFLKQASSDYTRTIGSWIADSVRAAKVVAVRPQDDAETGTFDLEVEFTSPNYAQTMRGNLMVFKPVVLSRRSINRLTAAERTQPVVIHSRTFSEESVITLPEGFRVGEMGETVHLDEAFGSYRAEYEVNEGRLHFRRSLVLRPTIVPAENYASARRFFDAIVRAEQTPVVLERVRN